MQRAVLVAFTATCPGFVLAADDTPVTRDPAVREVEFDRSLFKSDPVYPDTFDPSAQIAVYGGKRAVDSVNPPINLGRDFYGAGPLGEGINLFGENNLLRPQLIMFADSRTAVAFNDNGAKELAQVATRLDLFFNLQLTGTERVFMNWRPLQDNADFTRYEFGGGDRDPDADPQLEAEGEPNTLFFEGDVAAIVGGLTGEYRSWDLPFAFGRTPLFFQNGTWIDDAILGGAFTIPAKNSSALDITNFDVTFFYADNEVNSDAFLDAKGKQDDGEARMYGVAGFFDVAEGYLEAGYAYLEDIDGGNGDFSYHNFTLAFSKRYFGKVSNGTRLIVNVGQDPGAGRDKTADGFVVISENALITHLPLTLIPYANFWLGKDQPQSAARNGAAGGVLKNVGLAFESDNLTGFPTLDATAHDTLGGAVGLQYLFALDQQVVVEAAAVFPWDDQEGKAKDNQYALSARYQIPVTNQVILRADAIMGFIEDGEDIFGARFEVRVKF